MQMVSNTNTNTQKKKTRHKTKATTVALIKSDFFYEKKADLLLATGRVPQRAGI